jgi:hypothetical protein
MKRDARVSSSGELSTQSSSILLASSRALHSTPKTDRSIALYVFLLYHKSYTNFTVAFLTSGYFGAFYKVRPFQERGDPRKLDRKK